MKITIEIRDKLFREVKQLAARKGVPMRMVIIESLQSTLRNNRPAHGRFKLKTITTKGEGLISDREWSAIRSLIYEGHGG